MHPFTTLLKERLGDAYRIDLLRTDERMRYEREPSRLREEVRAIRRERPIVIDEIQKVPRLLDEVHYLLQEDDRRFVLCGSSARKIRRSHANLLGGRALKRELLGLSAYEIGDAETAIEVKGKPHLHGRDTKHLDEFQKEHPHVQQRIVACAEPRPRITASGIRILPYGDFIQALWNDEII